MNNVIKVLACQENNCAMNPTWIDNKGFTYCAAHGARRQNFRPAREMRKWEISRLEAGKTIMYERMSEKRFVQKYENPQPREKSLAEVWREIMQS